MKKLVIVVAVAAFLVAGAAQAQPPTVTVAMHDPGCHWFSVGSTLLRSMNVRGPIQLVNHDEAALKIVGPAGTKVEKVGKAVTLGKGTYKITMVGQAPDDNHLKLVVR